VAPLGGVGGGLDVQVGDAADFVWREVEKKERERERVVWFGPFFNNKKLDPKKEEEKNSKN
jgi:hypothetical protein